MYWSFVSRLRNSQVECLSGRQSSGVWHCVVGRVVPDVSKGHSLFIFGVKQSRKNYFIHWELLAQRNMVTSQKTWIFSSTAGRTSDLSHPHNFLDKLIASEETFSKFKYTKRNLKRLHLLIGLFSSAFCFKANSKHDVSLTRVEKLQTCQKCI